MASNTILSVSDSGTETPANWSVMDDRENVSVVQLQPSDQEYQDVLQDFDTHTGGTFTVVKASYFTGTHVYVITHL